MVSVKSNVVAEIFSDNAIVTEPVLAIVSTLLTPPRIVAEAKA